MVEVSKHGTDMASGINLHGFSPPVVPQANGREWVLEVGKLFWSLKPFFLLLTLLWALCVLSPSAQLAHVPPVSPVQPSHAAGHIAFCDIQLQDEREVQSLARKVPLVQ